MEPLAAFSLAANVLEVVNFSLETASLCKQICEKGATDGNLQLERNSVRLHQFAESLAKSIEAFDTPKPLTAGQQHLSEAADDCKDIVADLQHEFSKLKVKDASSKHETFRKITKAILRRKTIEKLQSRLRECQDNLQTLFLADKSVRIEAQLLQQQAELNTVEGNLQVLIASTASGQTQELLDSFRKEYQQIQDTLRDQTSEIKDHLDHIIDRQAQSQATRQRYDHVLASLRSPAMNQRRNQVYTSDQKVFEWIWEHEQKHAWSPFSDWLRDETDIYWISGKPGSGKSSLAKYISAHTNTLKILEQGRPNQPTIILSHFFWIAGTIYQRNSFGLLSTLLYQLLESEESLIDNLVSKTSILKKRHHHDWSLADLTTAVRVSLTSLAGPCLILLDGLDEFDPVEGSTVVLRYISDWKRLPNVKLCISSRPEPVFARYFEICPSLKLQDLTSSDMHLVATQLLQTFLNDNLGSFPRGPTIEELVNLLVSKAEGVFLWIHVVLRSVLRGLTKGDDWNEMMQRVKSLPSDMQALYVEMWKRCNEDSALYRKQTSNYFNIVLLEKNYRTFRYHHDPTDSLLDITLAVHPELHVEILDGKKAMTEEEIIEMCMRTKHKMLARCAGLVEFQNGSVSATRYGHNSAGEEQQNHWRQQASILLTGRMNFIHRTAMEFLTQTPEGDEIIRASNTTVKEETYDWLMASLTQAKLLTLVPQLPCRPFDLRFGYQRRRETLTQIFLDVFCESQMSKDESAQSLHNLAFWFKRFAALEDYCVQQIHHEQRLFDMCTPSGRVYTTFLGFVAGAGLSAVLKNLLNLSGVRNTSVQQFLNHLLCCASAGYDTTLRKRAELSTILRLHSTCETIEWLLAIGADPKSFDGIQTARDLPLTLFMNKMLKRRQSSCCVGTEEATDIEIRIVKSYVRSGADLSAQVAIALPDSRYPDLDFMSFHDDVNVVYRVASPRETERILVIQASAIVFLKIMFAAIDVAELAEMGGERCPPTQNLIFEIDGVHSWRLRDVDVKPRLTDQALGYLASVINHVDTLHVESEDESEDENEDQHDLVDTLSTIQQQHPDYWSDYDFYPENDSSDEEDLPKSYNLFPWEAHNTSTRQSLSILKTVSSRVTAGNKSTKTHHTDDSVEELESSLRPSKRLSVRPWLL